MTAYPSNPLTTGGESPPAFEALETASALTDVVGLEPEARQAAESLARQTHALARALGRDPSLREAIRNRLTDSPFTENKLDFRALVADDALGLASRMADGSAWDSESEVRSAVDSVMPLSLYFPVKDHSGWRPTDSLLVASLYSDDHPGTLVGFDLDGNPVQLNIDEPPLVPTLVLSPSETDFSVVQSVNSPDRFGTLYDHTSDPGGLFLKNTSLPDLHEPWPNGDPESYVHVGIVDTATDEIEFVSCAGDAASSPFFFDQNGEFWSGQVRIADAADIRDHDYEVQVWEDDHDRCDGTSHLTPHSDLSLVDLVASNFKAAFDIVKEVGDIIGNDTTWVDRGRSAWGLYQATYDLASALTKDDLVGVLERLPHGCYEDATGVQWYGFRDKNDNHINGSVALDDDFIERELCDLTVSFTGPTELLDCGFLGLTPQPFYDSNVFGGIGTPTYKWFENSILRGTSANHTLVDQTVGLKAIHLEVTRGTEIDWQTTNVQVVSSVGREDECEIE